MEKINTRNICKNAPTISGRGVLVLFKTLVGGSPRGLE